ncbi:MAG TPA: LD-carboxypeptidase [Pyrinomonadaceae bacterium]
MKRRDLLKGLAAVPFLGSIANAAAHMSAVTKLVRPKRLKAGQTVALISPSSGLPMNEINKAIDNMNSLGLKSKLGKYADKSNGFLAGTDAQRVEDIHWAFTDPSIDAVWCLRGGYGLSRILPQIDFAKIRGNPKPFIGYSDITALHVAIHQRTGMVTFHGPVATSTLSDYTKDHVIKTLFNGTAPDKIAISPDNAANTNLLYKTQVITPGKARGQLIGGNLSLLSAVAGTLYALKDVRGKILFTEDVGEKPYRIDRMFVQLKQSVDLRSCAGIALGIFADCDAPDGSPTVIDVIKDQFSDLGIPVMCGLSFGHIRDQFTLPLGVEAEMDTASATVTLLEPGVR